MLETLLGLTLEDRKLRVKPRMPGDWDSFRVDYRYRETTYHITVVRTSGGTDKAGIAIDGVDQADNFIGLVDDRALHAVEVRIKA
jgi:cellobiose phosphorylase